MGLSAAAPAPGAATIRADRPRVKRPWPAVTDTGLGTMAGAGAALAAGPAGLAASAKAIAGMPMTIAADAASQPPRLASLAGRKSFRFTVAALDAVRGAALPRGAIIRKVS